MTEGGGRGGYCREGGWGCWMRKEGGGGGGGGALVNTVSLTVSSNVSMPFE